ncbi:MAG: hypothetical protein C0615_05505 [Desulfuromonas sp.]|nr:MAG: hypothetical protein C0615_05505 [Desulfuromonas sp.]
MKLSTVRTPIFFLTLFLWSATALSHPHILKTEDKSEVSSATFLEDLRQAQVIFIGELHDHIGHHQAQLAVIDALDDDPKMPLAIGLEMFQHNNQHILDRWVDNELPLERFLVHYHENWGMWPQYQDIFFHARENGTRMIGLNIPRQISNQVAAEGFQKLPEDVRKMLGDVRCVVGRDYETFIRQAMGGFGGHGAKYLYFCEAQLLWDSVMARNLVSFLEKNRDFRIVVIAGSGHSWKYGIPRQMLREADISFRVILPELFGRADRLNITDEIADYLWLDVGDDGWTLPEEEPPPPS